MKIRLSLLTRILPLLALALLTSCGDLPQPFAGNPGSNAARLVQPPPAQLFVDEPSAELLPPRSAALYVTAMADALAAQDVPAISQNARKGDWRLALSVERQTNAVVPLFTVFDAAGAQAGVSQGQPVPLAQWNQASVETLRSMAVASAVGVADLLTRIEAARRAADPNSLLNRGVKMFVAPVTGAPGDGNAQLTRQMKAALAAQSLQIDERRGDITVAGQVMIVPIAGKQERVEIQWIVTDSGGERARIVQLNEINAGMLNRNWGDVAVVVAEEAAAGIKDVVARLIGSRPK
jgi:hypothetical protein